MLPMSSLTAIDTALAHAAAAVNRPRPTFRQLPLIDAPHTQSALAAASSAWDTAAQTHARGSAACWSEATRFFRQVRAADDALAGWLR